MEKIDGIKEKASGRESGVHGVISGNFFTAEGRGLAMSEVGVDFERLKPGDSLLINSEKNNVLVFLLDGKLDIGGGRYLTKRGDFAIHPPTLSHRCEVVEQTEVIVVQFNAEQQSLDKYFGNAVLDSDGHRGWFVGHFMKERPKNISSAVEIKWGVHKAGEKREQWSTGNETSWLSILISGEARTEFSSGVVSQKAEGDYIFCPPGTPHKWEMLKDSLVLTVRWPSLPPKSVA